MQVGEEIGKTETDLTELRRSSKKAPNEGASSSPVRAAQVPPLQLSSRSGAMNAPQSKHRSLHSLLGTPQRSIGKAVLPTRSPFDKRHGNAENHEWEAGQPPKRRRITDPPPSNAWQSTTNKPFVSASAMNPPTRDTSTPMHARKKQLASTEPIHQSLGSKDQAHRHSAHSALPIPSSSPAFQRQKTPEHVPKQQHTTTQRDTPAPHKPHANPSTNQNERHSNPPKAKPTTQPTPPDNPTKPAAAAAATTVASSPKGTTLRMIASAPKRKTLLFQQQQQHTGKRKAPSPTARDSLDRDDLR